MCTVRPGYQPGYTVLKIATPFAFVRWIPRMKVLLARPAPKPE